MILDSRVEVNGHLVYEDCSALGRSTVADAGKALVIHLNGTNSGAKFKKLLFFIADALKK